MTSMLASTSVVTPLEIVFYALSIIVIIGGGTVAAFKAAAGWGAGRATWDEQCQLTKQLSADVKELHACVDRRFTDVNRRIDQLPGGKP